MELKLEWRKSNCNEDINWFNIAKKKRRVTIGNSTINDAFLLLPITLSFDAFSRLPEGKLQAAIQQVGPDGNNPQISQTINVTSEIKDIIYLISTDINTKRA